MYAIALIDRSGTLLGYVPSVPTGPVTSPRSARKFSAAADAACWADGHRDACSALGLWEPAVVGLVRGWESVPADRNGHAGGPKPEDATP